MTTYFSAAWHHDRPDEPVFMWHELDETRNDLRVVEEFRDGTRLRADQEHPNGETRLSEKPLPSLEAIDGQAEFSVHPVTAEQFELVWRSAAYSSKGRYPLSRLQSASAQNSNGGRCSRCRSDDRMPIR